jgi:hypothetical protein
MTDYKLYALDGRGQIAGAPELISAATDRQAEAAARELGRTGPSELWQGPRLVARIERRAKPSGFPPHRPDQG